MYVPPLLATVLITFFFLWKGLQVTLHGEIEGVMWPRCAPCCPFQLLQTAPSAPLMCTLCNAGCT